LLFGCIPWVRQEIQLSNKRFSVTQKNFFGSSYDTWHVTWENVSSVYVGDKNLVLCLNFPTNVSSIFKYPFSLNIINWCCCPQKQVQIYFRGGPDDPVLKLYVRKEDACKLKSDISYCLSEYSKSTSEVNIDQKVNLIET